MKKFIFLFSVLFLVLSLNAQAQFRIGDYIFTNTTAPYAPLVGDSTVNPAPNLDDGITDAIQIGFTFGFGNNFFSAFKINTNGWMTFNLPTTTGTTTTPITTTATVQIISPFARDLDTGIAIGLPRLSILRSGVAPNRITKIQWDNFASFSVTVVPERASFQVWIYETSNLVEMRYGSVLAGTRTVSGTVQVGLKSGSTAADSVRTVQGATWPTATVSNSTASKTIGIGDLPDSNRVYRFTPATQQANDVTPQAIVSPVGVLASCQKTIAPKATVRNVGMNFAAFSVTFQITGPGTPYTSTRSDTLSASASRTITFDSTFSPTVAGTYNLRVFTTFPVDTNRANDTIVGTIQVLNMAGGGLPANCNYFFANSLPCTIAPDKPVFGWIDTAGSISLIIDSVIQTPPGVFNGSKDDGHFRLEIPGPDQFRFCGVVYDSFFVTTNGQIGLTLTNNTGKINNFSSVSIPSTSAIQPGLFPFWRDFSYVTNLTGSNRLSYKTMVTPGEGLVLLITYDKIPNRLPLNATDYASFQIILQLSPGPTQDGRIIYQYDDSRTGATFLDRYFNWTLPGAHTVGIQDQTGTQGVQYRRVTGTGMASVVVPGPLYATPVAVAFGPDASVLPVELASFSSTVNRRDVTLNWSTSRETNNSGFEIERSLINGSWSKLGFVQGNGTSSSSFNYTFSDKGLNTGNYNYRLKQIDYNGNYEYFNLGNEVNIGVPTRYDLSQNYPNPFNPTTKINYDLPHDGKVSIKLFDMSGREVATLVNNVQTAGYYTATFNGANLASGTYFYRLSADGNGQNFVSTKKMVLIK